MNDEKNNEIKEETANKTEAVEDTDEDNRPSYKKKRVIVPAITAIVFFIVGIYFRCMQYIFNQQMTHLLKVILYQ